MKVGDGFYTFGTEHIGSEYELRKRWISELTHEGCRSIGGATDQPHRDWGWPCNGDPNPKKAFDKGKKRALDSFAIKEAELREKLQALKVEERRMRGLRFEDVRIRGDGETYEEFKRGWDMDY